MLAWISTDSGMSCTIISVLLPDCLFRTSAWNQSSLFDILYSVDVEVSVIPPMVSVRKTDSTSREVGDPTSSPSIVRKAS